MVIGIGEFDVLMIVFEVFEDIDVEIFVVFVVVVVKDVIGQVCVMQQFFMFQMFSFGL